MAQSPDAAISKAAFEQLSEFRYEMRRFLRFSERACRSHGITPLYYQLLLHIKGFRGREYATVGELAERLQAHHHGVVALISRCEKRGLVVRRRGREDRREVEVHLSKKGERLLVKLATLHLAELRSFHGPFPTSPDDA
jgi:DNA-binding MarR family transcriptional regulator